MSRYIEKRLIGRVDEFGVGWEFDPIGWGERQLKNLENLVSDGWKMLPGTEYVDDATEFLGDGAVYLVDAINKIPVLGSVFKAVTTAPRMAAAAASAIQAVADGERIDRAALDMVKKQATALKDAAEFAPMVMSFVPGVGTGVSAALTTGLALAQGQNITEAMLAAAKAAVPGGQLAQAAFSAAEGIVQGKPIDQIAIAALPVSPDVKRAINEGLALAKDVASGKPVDKILMNRAEAALAMVPDAIAKGITAGAAVASAQALQALKAKQDEYAKLIAGEMLIQARKVFPDLDPNDALQKLAKEVGLTPEAIAEKLGVPPLDAATALNAAAGFLKFPTHVYDQGTGFPPKAPVNRSYTMASDQIQFSKYIKPKVAYTKASDQYQFSQSDYYKKQAAAKRAVVSDQTSFAQYSKRPMVVKPGVTQARTTYASALAAAQAAANAQPMGTFALNPDEYPSAKADDSKRAILVYAAGAVGLAAAMWFLLKRGKR